jgi:hypothetical protein
MEFFNSPSVPIHTTARTLSYGEAGWALARRCVLLPLFSLLLSLHHQLLRGAVAAGRELAEVDARGQRPPGVVTAVPGNLAYG